MLVEFKISFLGVTSRQYFDNYFVGRHIDDMCLTPGQTQWLKLCSTGEGDKTNNIAKKNNNNKERKKETKTKVHLTFY